MEAPLAKSAFAGIENIAHLEEVPETGAYVLALPIKTAGGSGGPVRMVALLPPAAVVAPQR